MEVTVERNFSFVHLNDFFPKWILFQRRKKLRHGALEFNQCNLESFIVITGWDDGYARLVVRLLIRRLRRNGCSQRTDKRCISLRGWETLNPKNECCLVFRHQKCCKCMLRFNVVKAKRCLRFERRRGRKSRGLMNHSKLYCGMRDRVSIVASLLATLARPLTGVRTTKLTRQQTPLLGWPQQLESFNLSTSSLLLFQQ